MGPILDLPELDWDAPLGADINDLCFFDTETQALSNLINPIWGDVTTTSTRRYAKSCKVIIFTYAIGDGEVKDWVLDDFSKSLRWRDLPPDLADFIVRVRKGKAWFVAHHAAFDRQVCNHGMVKDSKRDVIAHHEILDSIVQFTASNLPAGLDLASKAVNGRGKLPDGKRLIKKFCVAGGATPQEAPEDWATFREYAKLDVDEMRFVWKHTMLLPAWQWREYWASEIVNDRGLPLDVDYVKAMAKLAADYKDELKDRVTEITDGDLYSPMQHAKIAEWVWDRIEEVPDGREAMVKVWDEDGEVDGDAMIPVKIGCDRQRTARLIALLDRMNDEIGLTDEENAVRKLLIEKEYGASTTPGKFQKMLDHMLDDGSLPSQYVFNGAQQTGRYSSKGVQMHNLTNKTLGYEKEIEVIEAVLDGATVSDIEEMTGDDDGPGNAGRAISLLVRPAIMAPPGRCLAWGDESNIEARVLPWLANAEERLDIFRNVDVDPTHPDVYTISAASMDKLDLKKLWKEVKAKSPEAKQTRQKGKIAELSLGFGGANGALLKMATAYGMAFTEAEASKIVSDWRAANPWAKAYWDEVWEAFTSAAVRPGEAFQAGKVVYLGVAGYLGEVSIFCYLPDGRALVYRNVKFERREVINPKTGKPEMRSQYTFASKFGRKGLWYGILVENITQAVAASILRLAIRRLVYEFKLDVRGHTHDEIVIEDDEGEPIKRSAEVLDMVLKDVPEWATGLPLNADITINEFYTKAED